MVAPQPFFRARGTPFSVLHRIRALTSRGHRVTLLTYPFGEDIDIEGLLIDRIPRPRIISDVIIGPSWPKVLLDWYLFRKTIEHLKTREYHVLHSHEEAAFFCTPLAKRFSILHVYDMHSSLPQQLSNFGRYDNWPLRTLFELCEKYTLRRANGVISICNDLAEIVQFQSPTVPHALVENTADDRKIFLHAPDFVPVFNLPREKRLIVYTGTMEKYQGIELLLNAFHKLCRNYQDIHLLIAGGTEAEVAQLRGILEARHITDRVICTGTVHPSVIPAYLSKASILVSPRIQGTNTPLKIYSYLRSGVPLVATDIVSHTQCLNRNIAELVPATADDFVSGIARLLDDPPHAAQLATAALEHATLNWSDESYIENVNALYEKALQHYGA
jgi:glycosyltransferase involved in cell wall biosynthesis